MFRNIIDYTRNLWGFNKKKDQKTPRVINKSEHGIDRQMVSKEALRTCENLQQAGYEAYVVGGAVRDLLLGVPPKDFDVVTNATPEQVKQCQRRAIIIGRRFRLVHVMFGREIIECSTFRALGGDGVRKDGFGRVVSDNVFGEMWEDAARRDFTINSLYYDPSTELIYDYHDGMRDIYNRVVRIIGEPAVRYREDPVRMLRAVRIAAKLQFEIEPATLAPITEQSRLLANVPDARLFDEAMKLLTCGHALRCLQRLRELKLDRNVLPLLEVVLREPNGSKFLEFAMKRTDERIALGKKVSPSFLYATILWPLTHRYFQERLARGMSQMQAMVEASRIVMRQQGERLAIQNRFVDDIQTIWLLQLKLLRRGNKSALGLLNIPKFRAGYDFMLLRSQLGFVDEQIVQWWTTFQEVDEEGRLRMVREEAENNAVARKSRRGEPKKPSKAQIKKQLIQDADSWQEARDVSYTMDANLEEADFDWEAEEFVEPKKPSKPRRRRNSYKNRTRREHRVKHQGDAQ